MSEFWDLEDLALLMFGMMNLLMCLVLMWLWFVVVCGRAVLVRYAHVDVTGMLTGSASICCYTSSPALAITGG